MHVVIVGAGIGGIKTALELSKRQIGKITLISKETYFIHHDTFYATLAGKYISEPIVPLSFIFENHPNVEIIQDKITSFDPNRHLITGKKDYHYDTLVLALGLVRSYFGDNTTKKQPYTAKSIQQIHDFQDTIHDDLVNKKLDRNYFVIGAGPTGIEMAASLNEYLKKMKTLYRLKQRGAKVTIVEASARVLPELSKTASDKVTKQLKKEGIQILTNHTSNRTSLSETTTIWACGAYTHPFFKHNSDYFHLASDGRVMVNPYLEAFDDVYVIGDNSSIKYSGTAWSALKQARYVAKNITRRATKRPQVVFTPIPPPISVAVTDTWAYIERFGIYIAGRTGLHVHRQMQLHQYCQLLSFHKAVSIWRTNNLPDSNE